MTLRDALHVEGVALDDVPQPPADTILDLPYRERPSERGKHVGFALVHSPTNDTATKTAR